MEVTVTVPYSKAFKITREVDWDDEAKKDYHDEEEYFDAEFADEFEEAAIEEMTKKLDEIDINDMNWDDAEYDVGDIDDDTW